MNERGVLAMNVEVRRVTQNTGVMLIREHFALESEEREATYTIVTIKDALILYAYENHPQINMLL